MAPRVACEVIDAAIQLHGGAGVSQDTHLAWAYINARTLRLADGPDEVHLMSVAKEEMRRYHPRIWEQSKPAEATNTTLRPFINKWKCMSLIEAEEQLGRNLLSGGCSLIGVVGGFG